MATKRREKAKVLYTAFERIPAPCGFSCWVVEEIKYLSRFFQLDILSLKSDELSHIERFRGARLLRVPVGTGSFLSQVQAFQRAIKRQLDSEEYSLCHFTSVWEGMVLIPQKKTTGCKLLFELHSIPSVDLKVMLPDEIQQIEKTFPLKTLERDCMLGADQVIVGSQLLRDQLVHRGLPEKHVGIVRPGIDLTPFVDMEDIPRVSQHVLYLGNLKPWQGLSSLIMAVDELSRQMPIRLLLVSPKDEPWLRKVQGKIQMQGLSRIVEFIDPAPPDQLPNILKRANVCVAPIGNHEHNQIGASTPHKILHYMASRRPTVASDQPITKEILSHSVHGLLYPPGDISGLVESIRKLLLNRDTAIELGAQARIHLEKSLSLNLSTQSLSEYYEKLIGKPKSEEVSSEAQKQKATVIVQKPPEKLDESIKSPLPPPPTPYEPFTLSEDTAPFFMKDDGPPTQPAVSVPLQFTEEDTAETDIQFLPVAEPVPIHSGEDHGLALSPTTPNAEDQWQVMELSQVDLSQGMVNSQPPVQPQPQVAEDKKKSGKSMKKASAKKSDSGPITQEIIVPKSQNITVPSSKPPASPVKTVPGSKPSKTQETTNDLELIPDADVELIDSEDK